MEELLTMSNKELDRAGVMSRLVERRLSQEAAAETLGVGIRPGRGVPSVGPRVHAAARW